VIEKQLADRMQSALTDEPPLGFDPDELVDRARHRRRSTFATAGASGVVLAIAVTAVVMTGTGGPGGGAGAQVLTTSTTSANASTGQGAVCTSVPPGGVPPLNFPGSAQIVTRLDEAAPKVIAAHLPGVTVQPSETGMLAYDCPPNLGTYYQVNGTDQRVMIYLIHARGELDLANDRYADDENYQLVGEDSAPDGARIRTYEYNGTEYDPTLVAVRFGQDGMITEAYLSGTGQPVANRAELVALASDPELRF
jgi:hypothetical protein